MSSDSSPRYVDSSRGPPLPTNSRVPAYNPPQTVERGMLAQLMSVQGAMCREIR